MFKLYEYGELNQSKLMSYCGLNNVKHKENLFEIMDGIISQLNKTKKMFILMIITILILPPISFVIAFAVFGPPMFVDNSNVGMRHEGFRFGPGGFGHGFALARLV